MCKCVQVRNVELMKCCGVGESSFLVKEMAAANALADVLSPTYLVAVGQRKQMVMPMC